MSWFHSVQRASLVMGTIALTATFSGMAAVMPQAARANTATTTHTTQSATSTTIVDQLKLTEQQKNKIRGYRADRNRQINAVLTQAQKTKLQQELKSGMKLGPALKGLNLSPDQTKKIAAILQKSAQNIRGTLTADQQRKLDAYLKQQRQAAVE